MKKVLTFDKLRFAVECRRLETVVAASGFVPDVVLGIESGGRYVAELLFDGVEHCYVSLRRPGTAAKQGALTKVLRRMPRFVNDALRLAESWVLSRRTPRPAGFHLPEGLDGKQAILIVDDAVDSGSTMLSVRDAVVAAFPQAHARCAAIVVTTDKPLIVPDYSLYLKNFLIRFPWSADMKK